MIFSLNLIFLSSKRSFPIQKRGKHSRIGMKNDRYCAQPYCF